jgi:hypothetical protein
LGGADLAGADLSRCELVEAYLGGVKATKANFSGANLEEANLEEADFTEASFDDAQMPSIGATAANFTRAVFTKADLSSANLVRANFASADLRKANFERAKFEQTVLTGARIAGIVMRDAAYTNAGAITIEWADISPDELSKRVQGEAALAALTGKEPAGGTRAKNVRYFGAGDVLRFAALEFDSGASVEIESRFEQCSIALGEGTELVVGSEGVLAGCNIKGSGHITIHGQFFEQSDKGPGIVGPRRLIVTTGGVLVGSIQQSEEPTLFGFEPGSRLRVKITRSQNGRRT